MDVFVMVKDGTLDLIKIATVKSICIVGIRSKWETHPISAVLLKRRLNQQGSPVILIRVGSYGGLVWMWTAT
jgi:hypothetical protein